MLWGWHLLVHWTGSDYGFAYGQFQPYDFLSGVAGLSIFGLLIANLRKHNCHVQRCLRIGRHPVEGTAHTVCRKHSPDPAVRKGLTVNHIHLRHHEHLARQGDRPA